MSVGVNCHMAGLDNCRRWWLRMQGSGSRQQHPGVAAAAQDPLSPASPRSNNALTTPRRPSHSCCGASRRALNKPHTLKHK